MKQILVAACACAITIGCESATIQWFELSEGGSALSVRLSDGKAFSAPHTGAEQVGFSNVQISPDRQLIGWTATFPNCCTSYPLPLALVVHDGTRVVRLIGAESLSIFDWRFSRDSRSLIFQREFPHGVSPHLFRWVRISDGKLLRRFDCHPAEPTPPPARSLPPPKWTAGSHLDCLP
jgi:hypothetical protein